MITFIQNMLLINLSIAIVIATFILLRQLLKSRVHTKILCILWIVIFVRMLTPVPIESNFAVVENSFAADTYTSAQNYVNTVMDYSADNEIIGEDVSILESTNTVQNHNNTPTTSPIKLIDILLWVYVVGALTAMLYILISNILFCKKMYRNKIGIELNEADMQIFADQNIKLLKIFLVEGLHSPCLVGLIRPKILLSDKSIQNKNIRRFSLYHETTHFMHKDNFVLLIGLLACIINWFNPMMWIALSLSKKDREVLCDEHVVKKIGEQEVAEYGKSLLFIAQNNSSRLLSLPTSMTGGKREMEQRIRNLVSNKKRLIVISILVVLAVVSLIACTGLKTAQEEDLPEKTYDNENVLYSLHESPLFNEYAIYFEESRDIETAYIGLIYITDIDNDGTDELFAKSFLGNGEVIRDIIECYDLETDTYSSLLATEEWDYDLFMYEDKIYIFAIHQYQKEYDEDFRLYLPKFVDGKLTLTDIDTELEQQMLDLLSKEVTIGIMGDMDGSTLAFRGKDIVSISIYDISSEEVLLHKYMQEDSNIIDNFMLLYGNMEGLYPQVRDLELNHTLKAEFIIENDQYGDKITVMYGDEDYITAIEEDGGKGNWKNDGLKNFLITLADAAPQPIQ